MRILGIETSCDETAVCLIEADGEFGAAFKFKILGNALISQAEIHAQYGGVFPNLAKREHGKNLVPLTAKVLKDAGILEGSGHNSVIAQEKFTAIDTLLAREQELNAHLSLFLAQHKPAKIDAIAVTTGPGLEPALWVGINFARALSIAWDMPVVSVNHMEGHVLMPMMENGGLADIKFPLLSLLISGGHTEIVLSRNFMEYERIGQTRDDAVGEAFDKVARLMELGYPGGPEISHLAAEARKRGLPTDVKFTRPMMTEQNYDFSFSGLKTAVRKHVEQNSPLSDEMKMQVAREFEDTVADVLIAKTARAADEFGAQSLVVGGGVSANALIRERLAQNAEELGVQLLVPDPELATDNALMIALAGYFHAQNKEFASLETMKARGQWKLGDATV